MKVGIYCEFIDGNTIGGREFVVAVMAEWLYARGHTVELVHHSSTLSIDDFAARFGTDPSCMSLRWISLKPRAHAELLVARASRGVWEKEISGQCDLFISLNHDVPSVCHAPKGLLIVLFPFHRPFSLLGDFKKAGVSRAFFWITLRQWRYRWTWRKRLASYHMATSISEFVKTWTRRRWGIDSQIFYPPVQPGAGSEEGLHPKENLVLSVGRFSVMGVVKRQAEMMSVFREIATVEKNGWTYASVGGMGGSPGERALFESVQELGANVGGTPHANIQRAELDRFYNRARIFWHAAGLNEDMESHPELSEHFGISTVEAMLAGCVPVVINQGAQPEIVEHGVSGFLWNDLKELREYTLQLMRDEPLRQQMAAAAKLRAEKFTRAAFERRFEELLA